tara:strand:+ start:690 stop:1058 length:369 start_codon:yes stop_codon:yes gene_type:complete
MPSHKNFATWAGAVKDWNKHQAFRDELYGIPKKGSKFYDEVFEMFYGKPAEVDEKKVKREELTKEIQSLFFLYRAATGYAKTRLFNRIKKLEEEREQYMEELTPAERAALKNFNEENEEHIW